MLCTITERARRVLPAVFLAGALAGVAVALPGSEKFEAAWKLYQEGKPSTEAFEAVLADGSLPAKDRFNASYVLGVISLGQNDTAAALKRLDAAEKILPGRPQVAVRRAEALIGGGKLEAAEKVLDELKKSRKITKETGAAVRSRYEIARARLAFAKGDAEAALGMLDELARERTEDWEVHFHMARVFEHLDMPDEALYYYDVAIENDPKRDPHPAIYAYQRWASLAVSSNANAYNEKALKTKAIARYDEFLKRAKANKVPADLVAQVTTARDALKQFGVEPG